MRPLTLSPIAGAPEFVSGVSVIRGAGVPVVDLAVLLGVESSQPTRLILVRAGQRTVALAAQAVIGVVELAPKALADAPPILSQVQAHMITAIAVLDKDLMLVLQASSIVPDEIWPLLAGLEQP